jgi:hypothetical protein
MNKVGFISFLNLKMKYLFGFVLLAFVATACVAFSLTGNDDLDLARQEILLRNIGHQVLLYSGDSTSRVLPVKKIAENEYQIKFENEFSFQPDSLVKIISRSLEKNKLAHNYVVNVLDCLGKSVVYGYAMFSNKKDNIVPCRGRKEPKGCYVIAIKFENPGIVFSKKGYLMGGIPLLAFIGIVVSQSIKKRKSIVENVTTPSGEFKIGQTWFYPKKRQLVKGGIVTELTAKENKLLLIFAQSLNIIIERARLQKEIWEDEGVIVGRSLDMFISKLRKKLEVDPSIQLVNIHGKGYRLESSGLPPNLPGKEKL